MLCGTMKDIIVDALGALVSSVIGYIAIKFEKNWFKPKLTGQQLTDSAEAAKE